MQTLAAGRQLSQNPLDATFGNLRPGAGSQDAPRYDFLRPDRIPATQLRAIQLLHENLARLLSSSLSAYLRSFVVVNLVSLEQLSYREFVEGLSAQTLMVGLGLKPYDGFGVLEISPSLFFPVLETLLGGGGEASPPMAREITDIEQRLMEGFTRVIIQDLKEAWKSVAPIEFAIHAIEKEPQFLQLLSPSEAVVSIGMEISVGSSKGSMNMAIPSLLIKMVRQRFDQQWVMRRSQTSDEDQARMMQLVAPSSADVEVFIEAPPCTIGELQELRTGDLLVLDVPANQSLQCMVNGEKKFEGHLAQTGRRCVFVIDEPMENV